MHTFPAPSFGGTLTDTIAYNAVHQRLVTAGTDNAAVHDRVGGLWVLVTTVRFPTGGILPREGFQIAPDGRRLAVSFGRAGGTPMVTIFTLPEVSK